MFHEYLKEGAIPLPEEVVKALSAHCQRMMARSDLDLERDPFENFLTRIDFEKDLHEPWIPEYMAPLYGTEFYERCNDEQRLVLNHLGWAGNYQYTVVGESLTLKYNNACAHIFRQNGYDYIADYLERESVEEVSHIKTFKFLTDRVETHYLGRPMIRARMENTYELNPNGFRDFNGWTATSFYYWLRGHQNITLRAREQMLQDVESSATTTRVTAAHFRDETRHYATSFLLAEIMAEVEPVLPDPVKLEFICRKSFNGPQAGCNWIWPSVQSTPDTLIWETAHMLSNPIFKLDRAGVLDVLESVYTRRPTNEKWEHMRSRSIKKAMNLNDVVPWVPEKVRANVEHTLRYDADMGLPFARKAFKELKASWDKFQPAALS